MTPLRKKRRTHEVQRLAITLNADETSLASSKQPNESFMPQQTMKSGEMQTESQELVVAKAELQSKEQKLEGEKQELRRDMTKLETTLEKLENEKQELRGDIRKLENEKQELRGDIRKLENEKQELRGDIRKLETTLEKLETTLEKLEAREDSLIAEIRKAKAEHRPNLADECEQDLERTRERLKELRKKMNVVQGQLKVVSEQSKVVSEQSKVVSEQLLVVTRRLEENGRQVSLLTQLSLEKTLPYSYVVNSAMDELANQLINTVPEEKGAGVEVTELPCSITPDSVASPTLVTRTHSRGVCEAVVKWLSKTGPGFRAIITGSPGIGKTWSLLYILRRLLERREKILFASRKNELYVLFEPLGDGSYSSKSCKCAGREPVMFSREDVWVLVDPVESGNDIHYVSGRLILAASPNRKHFHNWEKDGAQTFHLNLWSEKELLAAVEELKVEEISQGTVQERLNVVGGAPRYIFSTQKFNGRKNDMDREHLSQDVVLKVLSKSPASQVEQRDKHLATLFLTYSLQSSEHSDIDYTRSNVEFTSHYAMLRLVQHVIENAFDEVVLNKDVNMATFYGAKFEDVACTHLISGGMFNHKMLGVKMSRQMPLLLEEAEPRYVTDKQLMISDLKRVLTQPKTMANGKRVLFIAPKNFPLLDFADSKARLFNATTNLKHGMQENLLRDLLEDCDSKKEKWTLNFYWCVPETVTFKEFSGPPISEDLRRRVRQFVLWIPRVPLLRKSRSNVLSTVSNFLS